MNLVNPLNILIKKRRRQPYGKVRYYCAGDIAPAINWRFIIWPPHLSEGFSALFSVLSSTSFCLGDLRIHTGSGITDIPNHLRMSWMTTLVYPKVSHNPPSYYHLSLISQVSCSEITHSSLWQIWNNSTLLSLCDRKHLSDRLTLDM